MTVKMPNTITDIDTFKEWVEDKIAYTRRGNYRAFSFKQPDFDERIYYLIDSYRVGKCHIKNINRVLTFETIQ